MSLFTEPRFLFPYKYRFPGQGSAEHILFVTRESQFFLWVRLCTVIGVSLLIWGVGFWLAGLVNSLGFFNGSMLVVAFFGLALSLGIIGSWWTFQIWLKSIGILTTQRLIKFIYTSPFNRYSLSLPLEMVVDTGAYSKGILQAWLGVGIFTARSSASSSGVATDDADRINKKYFYLENITHAEDFQQYVNKLLSILHKNVADLNTFRPFIPELKGEAREKFMEQFPEYWS